MGRIFEVPWGGVRELAESLLAAAAPLCAQQGRRIDVLVPRRGLCPVKHPSFREVVLPRHGSSRILWDHVTVRQYANSRRSAVLYNIKLVLPEGLRVPGFTSIHDLMYFPQPAKYNWREYLLGDTVYMRFFVRRTVRRAAFTHVDSECTAEDARSLFPEVAPDRFRPILLGVDAERFHPRPWTTEDHKAWDELIGRGLREPYVFHSGGLSIRKNVRVLAEAFRVFHKRHPEYQLALTGGSKPTMGDPRLARALNMLPLGSAVRLGFVSARQLALLYQRAAMFVFPSLYEGFGLPPLEAQAAGCPVICAATSSLPEVVGGSALMFDAKSPRALLSRMEELLDDDQRVGIIARGFANAATFTWEKTAQGWLNLADGVYAAGM